MRSLTTAMSTLETQVGSSSPPWQIAVILPSLERFIWNSEVHLLGRRAQARQKPQRLVEQVFLTLKVATNFTRSNA